MITCVTSSYIYHNIVSCCYLHPCKTDLIENNFSLKMKSPILSLLICLFLVSPHSIYWIVLTFSDQNQQGQYREILSILSSTLHPWTAIRPINLKPLGTLRILIKPTVLMNKDLHLNWIIKHLKCW